MRELVKKTIRVGLILGIAGVIYWALLFIPVRFSETMEMLVNTLFILLWIYLNYTTFSSPENKDYSLLAKLGQLYIGPLLIFIIGVIGKYYRIRIFSTIFSIYFIPFIDIHIGFLTDIVNIRNYLLSPFLVMFIITILTFLAYRNKILSNINK